MSSRLEKRAEDPAVVPSRFAGMHFFNPAPASTLVELVVTPATSDETLRSALDRTHRRARPARDFHTWPERACAPGGTT